MIRATTRPAGGRTMVAPGASACVIPGPTSRIKTANAENVRINNSFMVLLESLLIQIVEI